MQGTFHPKIKQKITNNNVQKMLEDDGLRFFDLCYYPSIHSFILDKPMYSMILEPIPASRAVGRETSWMDIITIYILNNNKPQSNILKAYQAVGRQTSYHIGYNQSIYTYIYIMYVCICVCVYKYKILLIMIIITKTTKIIIINPQSNILNSWEFGGIVCA